MGLGAVGIRRIASRAPGAPTLAALSLSLWVAAAPAGARAEPFDWQDVYFQDVHAWGRDWERSACFALSKQPLDRNGDGRVGDGDFEILVDDVEVPAVVDGGRAWLYDADRVAICFEPEHVPGAGADLAIEYSVSDFAPAVPREGTGDATPSATGTR